jgi:hypothetical protein
MQQNATMRSQLWKQEEHLSIRSINRAGTVNPKNRRAQESCSAVALSHTLLAMSWTFLQDQFDFYFPFLPPSGPLGYCTSQTSTDRAQPSPLGSSFHKSGCPAKALEPWVASIRPKSSINLPPAAHCGLSFSLRVWKLDSESCFAARSDSSS